MIGKREILTNAIKADEQQHVKLCPLKPNLCPKDLNHVRLSTVLPFNPLEISPWVWSRVLLSLSLSLSLSLYLSSLQPVGNPSLGLEQGGDDLSAAE